MAKAPERTSVPGPVFIRLLARLTDARLPASGPALADRLSQWIDWSRAVALAGALDGRLPAPAADAAAFDEDEAAECARMRRALGDAIDAAPELAASAGTAGAGDFAPFRQRHVALQRRMQTATGQLRGRLRDRLAAASPAGARLAAIDAVMEQTLSPREQDLLAQVPTLLGLHFERLRGPAASGGARPWLDIFRLDMRGVLRAELDVRFLPIDALLAALRTR
ncbi:DUF3348 domain-containing protein [Coralloluteibacterium stylophorae]|uniref:DUF3348 domain-containing protein n=1 Tax=Coralloluteibacterium stylophorae TaxID=1776034 RepID=A0A8J7VWM5_9GAMM|nr:DUF3348 domain-containing protein [Coralloluteibacterium stylophorae]MBS7456037.1 DUF3348 domain-containing protein [Coralloluteibacterium stylophorae]